MPTPITVSGKKFNDLNRNGRNDPWEPGLADWTIQLDLDNDGTIDAETTTDADGNYAFGGKRSSRAAVDRPRQRRHFCAPCES